LWGLYREIERRDWNSREALSISRRLSKLLGWLLMAVPTIGRVTNDNACCMGNLSSSALMLTVAEELK